MKFILYSQLIIILGLLLLLSRTHSLQDEIETLKARDTTRNRQIAALSHRITLAEGNSKRMFEQINGIFARKNFIPLALPNSWLVYEMGE